jgi:hypothetical protein
MLITGVLIQPLTVTIQPGEIRSSTTADFNFNLNTSTVTGGVPSYNYSWTVSNVSGSGSAGFSGATNGPSATPRVTGVGAGLIIIFDVTCTVTDSASNVVASLPSTYQYERP